MTPTERKRASLKAITAIGIGFSLVVLLVAVILEGGNPVALFNIPAFLIVAGGTAGAVMASADKSLALAMPKLAVLAFKGAEVDIVGASRRLVRIAGKARREGLLALESDLDEIDDAFTRKGVQLVVDGADSDLVRAVLQSELDGMAQRHRRGAAIFATAGGFAPTLGILGTVLSLVHVLENLSSPESLGHSIAGAFLATLYGVGSANLILLPIANKLRAMSSAEIHLRELVIDAVLSIQAGINPRMLGERLDTFLPPAERGATEPDGDRPAQAPAPARPAAEAA